MTTVEREMLIAELQSLTSTNVLRTDDEARRDRERSREICGILDVESPDDVLDAE